MNGDLGRICGCRDPSRLVSSGHGGKSVIGISGNTRGRSRLEPGAGVMGKTPPSLVFADRVAAWWCVCHTRLPSVCAETPRSMVLFCLTSPLLQDVRA